MGPRIMLVAVVLFLGSLPAYAEEPSRGEQKFLRGLTNALSDESVDVSQAARTAFRGRPLRIAVEVQYKLRLDRIYIIIYYNLDRPPARWFAGGRSVSL